MEIRNNPLNLDFGCVSVKVPILDIGKQDNSLPLLTLTCLIHGNEPSTLFIIKSLLEKLSDPICGRIRIILVSNPIATCFRTRHSYLDFQDMNRIAPGNNNGTVSERIARSVLEKIVGSDFYIDLHECKMNTLIQGIVIGSESNPHFKQSLNVLRIIEPQVVLTLKNAVNYKNSFIGYICSNKQIPGFSIEMPHIDCLNNTVKDTLVNSLLKLFQKLDLLRDENKFSTISGFTHPLLYIEKNKLFLSQVQGLFFPTKTPGELIGLLEEVGYVWTFDNKKIPVTNTFETGTLICISARTFVNAGDLLFNVAVLRE